MNLGHFITKNVQIARAFLYLNFCWTPQSCTIHTESPLDFAFPGDSLLPWKVEGAAALVDINLIHFGLDIAKVCFGKEEFLKTWSSSSQLHLYIFHLAFEFFWVVCEKPIGFCARTTQMNQKFWQINLETEENSFKELS